MGVLVQSFLSPRRCPPVCLGWMLQCCVVLRLRKAAVRRGCFLAPLYGPRQRPVPVSDQSSGAVVMLPAGASCSSLTAPFISVIPRGAVEATKWPLRAWHRMTLVTIWLPAWVAKNSVLSASDRRSISEKIVAAHVGVTGRRGRVTASP